MNIELEIKAAIAKVQLKMREENDTVRRVVQVHFSREFDSTIAAAFGSDVVKAYEGLEDLAFKKVTLPIDSLTARAVLKFESPPAKIGDPPVVDSITIKELRGLRAVGEVKEKRDETLVKLELVFEFDYADAPILFLCRHYAAWADLSIKSEQLELPLARATHDEPYQPKPGESF